jgi:hypothetical protein
MYLRQFSFGKSSRTTPLSSGRRPSELEVPETETAAAVYCSVWILIMASVREAHLK